MDLKQLEYFLRVAELGSFTKAAGELSVAQPALSRQVRLLEVELRQSLLTRNGRGAYPTAAGQLLMEHARGILHQVQRARAELSMALERAGDAPGELSGRIALGLPPSIARVMTLALIQQFREQLPLARLSVAEGLSVGLADSLRSGRLDIALLYSVAETPDLKATPLLDEALSLVRPKTQRRPALSIGLRDIANIPLVIPARPNAIRVLLEGALARFGASPSIALEVDGTPTILDLVASGAGCAVLPAHAVLHAPQRQAYDVVPILRPKLVTRLSMATSLDRPSTALQQATQVLIEALVSKHFMGAGSSS
jgi:LysR family transcriptional regulator, nitrogen assimilation regulatory protein